MAEGENSDAPVVADEGWQKTWAERVAAVEDALGKSQPPGAPPGTLLELPEELRARDKVPGGRLMILPPDPTKKRDVWLFATLGLSQPIDGKPAPAFAPESPPPSRLGFEFAIGLAELQPWAFVALCQLAQLALAPPAPIKIGTRIPFLFAKPKGAPAGESEELVPCLGQVPANHEVVGEVSSLLVWPALDREGPFVTSTGRFDLLVGTTIFMSEWELAKETSSAHLMLLLVKTGTGQKSDPNRYPATFTKQGKEQWDRIKALGREAVLDELYGPA